MLKIKKGFLIFPVGEELHSDGDKLRSNVASCSPFVLIMEIMFANLRSVTFYILSYSHTLPE